MSRAECVEYGYHFVLVIGHDRRDDLLDERVCDEREGRADILSGDFPVHSILLGECESITECSTSGSGDDIQCFSICFDSFLFTDIFESFHDVGFGYLFEVKSERARSDRLRNLVDLSGSEDELHMFGWLFESFEESVECSRREHMYLIDDIDLVCTNIGLESSLLDQVPHILYSVVRRTIDLDTIEHIPIIERDTVSTGMAWISILQIETIDSLREDTSRRRLTRSTRTRQDIGMTDTTLDQRGAEYCRDGILSDDRVPVFGPVLSIERHSKIKTKR